MGIYSGRNEMSLSYNDLTLLRYIQKRQMIPLSKTALHFQKNESSIRRTIEQINLYSSDPYGPDRKKYLLQLHQL